MPVIETRQLTKTFGRIRAVDGVSLAVNQGDIYGFVGKNGAGKSTLMKMVCGLTTPTAGEVRLFDCPPCGGNPRIGVLIEEAGLLPNLSAMENVMAKSLVIGLPDAKKRCEDVLAAVGLDPASRLATKRFSLGMRRRLGIALALVGSPDALVLDEPFNGLDPEGTRAMRQLLMHLNEASGVTVFISSHVIDQLDRMATRYGIIAEGRLTAEMTAEDVQEACAESLRVRTDDLTRTTALLQDRLPGVRMRVDADGAIVMPGLTDSAPVASVLRDAGLLVYEMSVQRRDVEDYFVSLMEGGRHA
ncbi:ATP-binding cassette domain-containing protein [Eggerthellaceae bacterium zg-887]|uniref:ABC transporter ATP-binding protein n=1 Tax=Xiamenia xianingshaonis TaxID=2682776 RepID=UPI00140BCC77|nr:ATP-binding cassette domain-containing protein [Xiamenia xianingshaonis]NHM15100.1 ATP-binding cassette domain-containing protein [Xiamenia xianingshaonis]